MTVILYRPVKTAFSKSCQLLPRDRAEQLWSSFSQPSVKTLHMPEQAGIKKIKGFLFGPLGVFCEKSHSCLHMLTKVNLKK